MYTVQQVYLLIGALEYILLWHYATGQLHVQNLIEAMPGIMESPSSVPFSICISGEGL